MKYWENYDKAYRVTNPGLESGQARDLRLPFLDPYLPADRAAPIMDAGCGQGLFLRYLAGKGYSNLHGIDISAGQLEKARKNLGPGVGLEHADAGGFFVGREARYAQIFMFDVLEHVKKEHLESFLQPVILALKPGGSLVIRTPNMASILGAYSRYLDITHEVGFTEQSLLQLMIAMGATEGRIIDQNRGISFKERLFVSVRNAFYRGLYRAEGRTIPTVFDKNVLMTFRFDHV